MTIKLIDYVLEQCLPDACVSPKLDPCDRGIVKIILLCHLDDSLVAGSSDSSMNVIEKHPNICFKMNRLGELVR